MEACRACLSTDPDMAQMDEQFINAYNLLTNLNVTLMDAMPHLVCHPCVEAVKYYLNFRERCITTETSLQEVLGQKIKSEESTSLNNLMDQKPEIKLELEEVTNDNCYEDSFMDCEDDIMLSLLKSEISGDEKPKKRKYSKRLKAKEENSVSEINICDVKPKRKKRLKQTLKEKIAKALQASTTDKFPCGLCEVLLHDQDELKAHVESHKEARQCLLCKETAHNWPNLVAHRITHIPKERQHCHMCNKAMLSKRSAEYHYIQEHFEGEATLLCDICKKQFETPRKLSKHMHYAHSRNTFICDYCSKVFYTRPGLKSHLKTHIGNKSYVCDICGFSCKRQSGLRQHNTRKHAPDKVLCKSCRRCFATQAHCDKHVCNVQAKICPVCGIEITKGFKRHLDKHSDVRRYKCSRCPAAYKTYSAWQVHTYKHEGVRTRQCEYCPRKFYSLPVLIKHRRIHTGEKPYICKICHKGFTGNNNLKVHMRVHGEYLIVKKNKPEDVILPDNFYKDQV